MSDVSDLFLNLWAKIRAEEPILTGLVVYCKERSYNERPSIQRNEAFEAMVRLDYDSMQEYNIKPTGIRASRTGYCATLRAGPCR